MIVALFWQWVRFLVPDKLVHCEACGQPLGFVVRWGHARWRHVECPPYAPLVAV